MGWLWVTVRYAGYQAGQVRSGHAVLASVRAYAHASACRFIPSPPALPGPMVMDESAFTSGTEVLRVCARSALQPDVPAGGIWAFLTWSSKCRARFPARVQVFCAFRAGIPGGGQEDDRFPGVGHEQDLRKHMTGIAATVWGRGRPVGGRRVGGRARLPCRCSCHRLWCARLHFRYLIRGAGERAVRVRRSAR